MKKVADILSSLLFIAAAVVYGVGAAKFNLPLIVRGLSLAVATWFVFCVVPPVVEVFVEAVKKGEKR